MDYRGDGLAAAQAEETGTPEARTVVQVRLTEAEKSRLARNAAEAGCSMSGYVRARAVYADEDAARADAALLREALWEARREGTNLNALLRLAHMHGVEGLDAGAANEALARLARTTSLLQEALAASERPNRRRR
ncbi:plasmid mobilization protein [Arabiibacter massiliensis]|uniref:plasmid mobilization protein n=1 Tax=Arabiibacter massiliensis TaxID=1870985 RepID=UPI00155B1303|nr:hypothetical protein [Arabiibacter massiliensis]